MLGSPYHNPAPCLALRGMPNPVTLSTLSIILFRLSTSFFLFLRLFQTVILTPTFYFLSPNTPSY